MRKDQVGDNFHIVLRRDSLQLCQRNSEDVEDQSVNEAIESRLGLHQEVSLIYVVDGYEASLLVNDGDRSVASFKSSTPLGALRGLAVVLRRPLIDALEGERDSIDERITAEKVRQARLAAECAIPVVLTQVEPIPTQTTEVKP